VTALPPKGVAPNEDLPPWFALNNESVRASVEEYLKSAREMLTASGLVVETRLRRQAPVEMILVTAAEWGADTIFVGAREHGFLDRLLVGSVSASMAARARCSFEMIRST
jgi:nucleotide-binding universal stress UspA family protein